jgi:endo-1,4-beta-xylanase
MRIQIKLLILFPVTVIMMVACKKNADNETPPNPGNPGDPGTGAFTDTSGALKTTASFPIGMAIGHGPFKNNLSYRNTVGREADQVTFDYQMKHGALVRDDGNFDFSRADELLSLANSMGLEVFGHTLVWHQNQNGNYLRSLTVAGPPTNPTNLLPTGDFEGGTGVSGTGNTLFTGWNLLVGGTSTGSYRAVAGNNSPRALEANVTGAGTNAYDMQAIGSSWTATIGSQYKVSVDIKASVQNGTVRLVNQNNQYQQLDITPNTTWNTYTWILTALEISPIIRLNFPHTGVYTIDNISVTEASGGPTPSPEQIATAVDTAMSRFIRNTVTRYAGIVKAWDVVNEPMSDGSGAVRTNSGTTTGDAFYWSQYLGRDYAVKAFQYAKAADHLALLFINDYNLESDNRKLDSLIAYVHELKGKGAQIDGIGTQMHISLATAKPGIETMFQKLAATGLKIRISELDIRMNLTNASGFTPSVATLNEQAAMYQYVIESYLKNIPVSQRFGITTWGVADTDSWYVTVMGRTEFPLLFDANYQKKPAYAGFKQALKKQ